MEDIRLATGIVKRFDESKGYGFIQPHDGSKDVIVHIMDVRRASLDTLQEGQVVDFEIEKRDNLDRGRAVNLRIQG